MERRLLTALSVLVGVHAALTAPAAEVSKTQLDFFESRIRPILAENCYNCHSIEKGKAKGGLTLDTRDALLKGGDDGLVIQPGDPEASVLIKAVNLSSSSLPPINCPRPRPIKPSSRPSAF